MITPDTASSATLQLWTNIPDYIQEWDGSNGYQMLSWLNGLCTMLQTIDDYTRDTPTVLITDVSGDGTTVTYYGRNDFSANQIVTVLDVNPQVYNVTNVPITAVASDGSWFSVASSATATWQGGGIAYSPNAVGWSKLFNYDLYQDAATIDQVNTALIVLPWLAQFVGCRLNQIPYSVFIDSQGNPNSPTAVVTNIRPYINAWIVQITTFNGFQRGSLSAFLNLFAIYISNINSNNPNVTLPFKASQLQILERTAIGNGTDRYVYDPYSIVMLVPYAYVPNMTYAGIYDISSITGVPTYNYSHYSMYTYYYDIPTTLVGLQSFANVNSPAGLSITVVAS